MQGLDVVGPVILEQELVKDRNRRVYNQTIQAKGKETDSRFHLSHARKWKCRVRCYARCIRNHVIRNFHAHHEPPRLKVIYSKATRYYGDGAVRLPI